MDLTHPSDRAQAGAANQYAELGTSLDYLKASRPCASAGDKSPQQLQDEINMTMGEHGYPFKNPQVKEMIAAAMASKGETYTPNPNFDEDKDLSAADKQFISGNQTQKALFNYTGTDACTTIIDPSYRQHAKNGQELLPQSGTQALTGEDIMNMGNGGDVSLDQVRNAKNEIYMRAGRPFQDGGLRDLAAQQGYQPRVNYSDADLTGVENSNAALLSKVESYMRSQRMGKIDSQSLATALQPPS